MLLLCILPELLPGRHSKPELKRFREPVKHVHPNVGSDAAGIRTGGARLQKHGKHVAVVLRKLMLKDADQVRAIHLMQNERLRRRLVIQSGERLGYQVDEIGTLVKFGLL